MLISSVLLLAGEPWNEKPYRSWRKREAVTILYSSPWARSVRAFGARRASHPVPEEFRRVVVLWLSSRTVREAIARKHVLEGTLDEVAAERFLSQNQDRHVVAVYRPDETKLRESNTLKSTYLYESLSTDELRAAAYLKPTATGRKVPPQEVRLVREEGLVLQIEFYFPRQVDGEPVIRPDETRVDFGYESPAGLIDARFDLPKMVRDGKPDL
ncbi:MAG: hypothetical protein ACRD5I_12810 [Candidatus Acidiferrales bacterium]